MKELTGYTWREISLLPKEKTMLFITIAPIEEHSRHLPLGTDIMLGTRWQKTAADRLSSRYPDWHFIILPFLPVAAGSMEGFPGCIYVKPRLLRKLTEAVLSEIASWGIKHLIITASHGDPFHNLAIEKACSRVNKRCGTDFISPLGSMFSGKRAGNTEYQDPETDRMLRENPDDFHAGWIETSMMLDIAPDLVGSFSEMPDITVKEREMINPAKYSAKTAGFGHLGYPRLSEKGLGKSLNESSSEYIESVAELIINGKDAEQFAHHDLYRIPFLRLMV